MTELEERAKRALEAQGWRPLEGGGPELLESELAYTESPDGEYAASAWRTGTSSGVGAPLLCSVGLPGSWGPQLWLVGVPRPEEVGGLLERHAGILSSGLGDRVLDLATGEVLTGDEAETLLEGPVALLVAEAQRNLRDYERTLRGCERTLRDLVNEGWSVAEVKSGSDYEGGATVVVIADAETELEENVRYSLTIQPGEWFHSVEGLGVEFGIDRRAPEGTVMSADLAFRLLREAREQERIGEEFALYREMCVDRGPDEEPPSPEEVRAEMERLRKEGRPYDSRHSLWAVAGQGTDDTFVVDFEPEPEGE